MIGLLWSLTMRSFPKPPSSQYMDLLEIIDNGQDLKQKWMGKLDGSILLFLALMDLMKEEGTTQGQLKIYPSW